MKKFTPDGYMRTNREMSKEPHIRGGYCWTCDRDAPRAGGKCRHCGARLTPYRAKKIVVRD